MGRHAPRSAPATAEPTPVAEEHPPVRGPHPGHIIIANQYTFEQKLRRMQKDIGCDPSREDIYRLQGVHLIETVRESLQLPVKTFDTACTYYHLFRLNFRDAEYNYQDATLAALFVACKVEDTIKKSKEILCAAYNLKNPEKPTTPDDKMFERPSLIIVGLERYILETVGFDFRVRYPQKLLCKLVRKLIPPEEAKDFFAIAYPMSLDLYKTFSPIKHCTSSMVLGIIELTARITEKHVEEIKTLDVEEYHTNRGCVIETMLDLLDMYTQFAKSTKIGPRFDLGKFIDVKIKINQEVDENPSLSRFEVWCDRCEAEDKDLPPITPGSATSPATTGSWPGGGSMKPNQKGKEGTMRFVFDAVKARREQEEVAEYFKEEYEEYEIEVEEQIPPEPNPTQPPRGPGGSGHGSRRDRGYNHHDGGWAPYHRNRHHDRHTKGRKGGYY